MKLFSAVVHNLESYGRMLEDLKKGNTPALCTGLGAIHKANFITAAAEDLAQPIVVLCEDDIAAARLASDLNAMAGEERALVYPSRDLAYRQMETISSEYEQARLGVLSRILTGDAPIVVASVQAVMGRTIPPDRLRESTFTVSAEQAIPMEDLAHHQVHRLRHLREGLPHGNPGDCGKIKGVSTAPAAFAVGVVFWTA